jgi:hypothetical protein
MLASNDRVDVWADGLAALRMIREALQERGPPGIVPDRIDGPRLTDEAEPIVQSVLRLAAVRDAAVKRVARLRRYKWPNVRKRGS